MDKPEISVNMPVYNGEKYISESIESILDQSFTNFELIIVDNGSTDETIEVIKEFDDDRIKLIQNEKNMGLAYSRNRAIQESQSKYIAILDSDDIATPNRLEEQYQFLETNHEYAMVGSFYQTIDENGKLKDNFPLMSDPDLIPAFLLFNNCFAQPSLLIRKNIIPEPAYLDHLAPAEDYNLWIRIIDRHKGTNIPKYLLRYRVHSENFSSNTKKQIESVKESYKMQLKQLNIIPNEEELNIHLKLSNYHVPQHIQRFRKKAYRWIDKLVEANVQTNRYNHESFMKVIKIIKKREVLYTDRKRFIVSIYNKLKQNKLFK